MTVRVPFRSVSLLCACCTSMLLGACSRPHAITQAELVRRSQEMMDAVPAGNQDPWKKYIADDVLCFDEKGRDMNKAALLADLAPMPKGYSGTIKIVNPKSVITSTFAVVSFDEDETETVFGQELHAKYHETDTWAPRNGDWQIVAGQVLRYYEDPAIGTTDSSKFQLYAGTYELAPGTQLVVTVEDGKLFRQRGTGPKTELIPEAGTVFFRKGVEGRTLFHSDAHGKIDTLIDRRNNEDIVWKKVQ